MRKNIAKVINAFTIGESCNEKTCSTDGKIIYSYNLPIAKKTHYGMLIRDRWTTKTTNSQIAALKLKFPDAKIVTEI